MRILCAMIALAAALRPCAAAGPPDPKAAEIARAVTRAMGGEAAWRKARYVRFDFIVKIHGQDQIERSHLWDKQTGRYRLEDQSATGNPGVVLFNIDTRQGKAFVAGKELEGVREGAAVDAAYHAYRSDIDWLALPWMWLGPDTELQYAGRKTVGGKAYDVIGVTVQAGSGASHAINRYEAYVSPQSHLIEKWEILGGDHSLWDWQYTTTGGIKLAADHQNKAKSASISMGRVKVLDKVDDAFLTDPGHGLAKLR